MPSKTIKMIALLMVVFSLMAVGNEYNTAAAQAAPSNSKALAPGKGSCISPNSENESNPVTYIWQADPEATKYWLWIDNESKIEWEGWVNASAADCSSGTGTCSFVPSLALAPGDYTWWILPVSNTAYGAWSDPMHFSITASTAEPLEKLNILAPRGEIITGAPTWPTAEWEHIEGAAVYIWYLSGPGLDIPTKGYYYPDAGTAPGETLQAQLHTNGYPINYNTQYTFSITAASDFGEYGDPNDAYDFTVDASTSFFFTPETVMVPDKPVIVSPTGDTMENPVELIWQKTPQTTKYWLWIDGPTGKVWDAWFNAEDVNCGAAEDDHCGLTLSLNLDDADYTWWILASNSAGNSAWSAPMHFSITASTAEPLEKLNILAPRGEIITGAPTWPTAEWEHIEGAAVYIWYLSGPGLDIPTKGYYYPDAGTAPGETLQAQLHTNGYPINYNTQYTFSITAASDFGEYGDPNDAYDFTVDASTSFFFTPETVMVPDKPVIVSPTGDTMENPVELIWQKTPQTTKYWLWIDGPTGKVWDAWFNAEDVNCGAAENDYCSLTLSLNLDDGNYTWSVLASNSAGSSVWSDPLKFTVGSGKTNPNPDPTPIPTAASVTQQPGKGVGISPSDTTVSNPVTFTWQADVNATNYWLWIDNDSGKEWAAWVTPSTAGCEDGSGTCSYAVPSTIADGDYSWWIMPRNSMGYGQWSVPLKFTIGHD